MVFFIYIYIEILVYIYTLYFEADRIAHCVNLLLAVWETWVQFLVEIFFFCPYLLMVRMSLTSSVQCQD